MYIGPWQEYRLAQTAAASQVPRVPAEKLYQQWQQRCKQVGEHEATKELLWSPMLHRSPESNSAKPMSKLASQMRQTRNMVLKQATAHDGSTILRPVTPDTSVTKTIIPPTLPDSSKHDYASSLLTPRSRYSSSLLSSSSRKLTDMEQARHGPWSRGRKRRTRISGKPVNAAMKQVERMKECYLASVAKENTKTDGRDEPDITKHTQPSLYHTMSAFGNVIGKGSPRYLNQNQESNTIDLHCNESNTIDLHCNESNTIDLHYNESNTVDLESKSYQPCDDESRTRSPRGYSTSKNGLKTLRKPRNSIPVQIRDAGHVRYTTNNNAVTAVESSTDNLRIGEPQQIDIREPEALQTDMVVRANKAVDESTDAWEHDVDGLLDWTMSIDEEMESMLIE